MFLLCRLAYALGVQPLSELQPQNLFFTRPHSTPAAASTSSSAAATPASALVHLNGAVLGVHSKPHAFVAAVRMARRRGAIAPYVSVFMHRDAIQVRTLAFCLCYAGHPAFL